MLFSDIQDAIPGGDGVTSFEVHKIETFEQFNTLLDAGQIPRTVESNQLFKTNMEQHDPRYGLLLGDYWIIEK